MRPMCSSRLKNLPNGRATTLPSKSVMSPRLGDKLKGAVKDTIGKATGDDKLRAEGAADKAKGEVKSFVGGVKDTVRDATD